MATPFTPEAGSISPPLILQPAPTEEQLFKDVTTPTGLKPINPLARESFPVADPFAGFADAPANFDQFQDAPAAPDAFAGFQTADDLDVKSVDELDKDRDNFNPVTYFAANPDAAKDPAKLKKLLDVYRKRREEGLTAGGVIKSAVTETPGLVADIAGGVKRLGERALDVTVQPVANVVLGALTGDLFDEQKRNALFNETRKVVRKGVAEVSAGTESATVGLVDLTRQGLRKLPAASPGQGFEFKATTTPKPKTDQELLRDISDDVSFRQNAEEILTGRGEAAKNFGLDKETLAKQGIELDENAIQQLSLVDPITMIATGGAFKLVGLGGKVLGTARTLEGVQYAAGKLADVAKYSAGKTIQGAGAVTKFVGKKLQGSGRSAALITGIGSAVQGAGTVEALAVSAATKAIGPVVRKTGALAEHFGKAIAGEVPISATAQKVLDYAAIPGRAASEVGKGAFTGIVAAAPFAVMADEDATAGALFGAGSALGAGGAVGAGAFRVVKQGASRRYFGENRPVLEDVASPAYGKDAALDAQHDANISKLSAQDASELNNFREALRQQGGEIYAVDRTTFRQKIAEAMPDATTEQLDIYENHSAFFDQNLGDRKAVYLNSDTKGLQHDAGHIFDAILSQEKRAELRTAVEAAFTPEQRKQFRDTYERRVGSKISDTAAVDEFIAEQFAALFNNVPVTELNAPKSLLNKFIDTVAEGAEALGIDLSAGATTPNLGAPVAVGIRKLFQNAAGDVIRANIEGVPATNVTPVDFGGTPPAPPAPVVPPPVAPVAPAPTPTPAPAPPSNVVPLPGSPNIRVTPEQVSSFTRTPQTPEARAAAAVRAAETGIDYARTEAKKAEGSPTSQIIERISDSMESGRPVVGIEHLGITSESTPAAPAGRTPRRAEQAAGYAALDPTKSRADAPADVVSQHSKNFVPVRWTEQGGTPTLIAMSLDKVLANIKRISESAGDPKVKELIPYPVENGALTPEGWREVVADAQAYSENQANGRKGDGGRLTVPEAGLSVPAETPGYTPKILSPERADFQNLIQGLNIPDTARPTKGKTPRNIKGQIFAKANLRPVELPSVIPKKSAGKQAFIEFPPSVIMEVNPLRNKLRKVDYSLVKELTEVTERIRAKDIVSATPRPEINYKAPVTDTITGGFLPGPERINEVKSALAESVKTGPLDFKTFISAFRDKYFSGWEDHPSFSEITKRFPESNLQNSYDVLREEFNQYFKYDNDQIAEKFKEAAGDPIKEAQAAEYATLQWGNTEEHLNSRLYELLQSEGRLVSPPTSGPFARTEFTQKALETVDWSEIRRSLQEMDPESVKFNFGSDIHRVEDLVEGLILNPEKSPNSVPKQDQPAFQRLLARGREQVVERGQSPGMFLPAPTEFRQKSLQGRTVEEFSDYVLKSTPEEFKAATDNMTGGLTGGAWNLGLGLKNAADVGVLKSYADKFSDSAKAAMKAGDFDLAFSNVTRGQFFREAYEAATGTGSAGAAFKRGTAGMESAKPPFPIEATTTGTASAAGAGTTEAAKFLPAEELAVGTSEQTPEIRVLPAAAGAGAPPTGPTFRPPPVAAGIGQRDEESPRFLPAPSKELQDLAKSYADDAGLPYTPKGGYAEVKPDLAKKLADFYDKAVSDPTNPEVAASYDALIRETEEQGKAILAAGYKIEPWTGAGEPYKNSAEAVADVRKNKHLFFRQTSDSFGTGESNVGNPMLAESSLVPGQTVNDVFRWVHDFFGHAKGDFQFGPRGEFNAWRAHSEMYSPEAQGALAGETLAQNSWVNYGPHLEGKNIPLAERPFAEQKNVVVPPELIAEASFLPRTESGRKLEESGYEIVPSGELGMRRVSILTPSGVEIASIQSVQRSPKNAEIAMVQKVKGAPKGLGEVLYREVGAQLKEDGVTKITGQVVSPEPLAIRRKIFGDFASIDINGEPATFDQALATAERLQRTVGPDNEVAAIEPVNEITPATRFLPEDQQDMNFVRQGDAAVKVRDLERQRTRLISEMKSARAEDLPAMAERLATVSRDAEIAWRDHTRSRAGFLPGKRDDQGRPLDKEGNIDYVKWQKEGISARKRQQAAPIEVAEQTGPVTEDAGNATGWILPDKKFVPLDAAFHEQYLANNAAALNKKFKTEFSDVASTDDRLVALNNGFVRLRNQAGRLSIEANSRKWPSLKSKVLETLQDREAAIDSLTISLLNDKGQQVDSTTASRLFEMSRSDKLNAIEEAVSTVRASSPLFQPGEERVSAAAVKDESGKIHTGSLHALIAAKGEPGFITNTGRFVTRNDAFELGLKSGQIPDRQFAAPPDAPSDYTRDAFHEDFNGGRFQPGEGLPGFEDVSAEQAGRVKASRRIAAVRKNNPEAVPPRYACDEAGEIIVSADGNPKPLTLDYDLINSPVAKEAAKGLKGAAREEAAAAAIGDKLVDFYKEAEKNPDLKAGSKWYSTARTRLRGVFGDDSKFFAELLGATSARTPVATNYRFALDAYNQFKAGAYDKTLAKYREGKAAWDAQELGDFKGETRGQFIDFWVKKHDLGVTQASGKKFGMNSRAVLRVLDGSWAAEVKGPKTPNFAGNLTGETYESTVDVWAARTLHRLANEGKKDRWRILPENETGVTDSDFYFGQAAYRHAAKKLGVKPDSVQSVLWFAEKKHWEDRGWTRGAGAELSDFNVLLKETEKTPTGMKMKTPQQEFGLDTEASIGDIVKKKR